MKLCRRHKIEGSIWKYRVPSLWLRYIGERRTIFAKAYGRKVRCCGEHVGEHIGNHGKMKKKSSPSPPPPKHKMGQKYGNLECMVGPSRWLDEISFPKRVVTIFGLG